MPRPVSWPMYVSHRVAVAGFWTELRQALAAEGLADLPQDLTEPRDLDAHWLDPALLLSHTCGLPFVTSLAGRVRYVATPRFAVPDCDGADYRSAVVVRRQDPAGSLAAMAGRRAAFNGRGSQSGYNGLRALAAPLATDGRFFGDAIETGSHRESLRAVTSGAADLAAIDVVTFAVLADHAPEEVSGVRVLCHTAHVPGLPLITAAGTSDRDLERLRRAVAVACRGETPATRALRLDGVVAVPEARYGVILAQRDAADALGYPELA